MRSHLDEASIRAIAAEVAALLARDYAGGELLSAAEVARRFGVDRGWVYAHADELGAIRLTDGPRARLRFDPTVVAERLRPAHQPAARRRPTRFVREETDAPLLPIRRRTLDGPAKGAD